MLGTVEGVLQDTAEAVDRSGSLSDILLNVDKSTLNLVCEEGIGPINALEGALDNTVDVFRQLLNVGTNATNLLNCEDINQIWVDVGHNALCTSTPTALSWMFSTMTALYIFGIFTFLFRGALLPVEVEEEYGEMPNEGSRSQEEEEDDQWGLLPAETGYRSDENPKVAKYDLSGNSEVATRVSSKDDC